LILFDYKYFRKDPEIPSCSYVRKKTTVNILLSWVIPGVGLKPGKSPEKTLNGRPNLQPIVNSRTIRELHVPPPVPLFVIT
jgi:hypothetical protein